MVIHNLEGPNGAIDVYLSPDTAKDIDDCSGAFVIAFSGNEFVMSFHLKRNAWEFPGGRREKGETPEECIRREAFEEAGAVLYDVAPIGYYLVNNSCNAHKYAIFSASVQSLEHKPEWSETGEVAYFTSLPENISYKDGVYVAVLNYLAVTMKGVGSVSKYWSDITKQLEPYIPGEQPRDRKYIKLNTNENPYPPSPRVIEAIRQAANDSLRLYPDPSCEDLRNTIADHYCVCKDQIFVGNGSDEILAFSFQAFFNPGNPVLFPDITYSFYTVYADLYNIDYQQVPLEADFSMPVESFLTKNGGIIIPNPNAPTAKYLPLDCIERILQNNLNQVVIIDEAYIDFGGESAIRFVQDYPNLLVVCTLSKSRSLAGLRVGYAIGHRDLIEGLDRVKNSFNSYTMDRLALAGAVEAIKDVDYFEETRRKVAATRDQVSMELLKLGFHVVESKANFIFISHPSVYAGEIFKELRTRGILVRYFNKPRIDNYLRVSIGTDEEMKCFLKALREIIDG